MASFSAKEIESQYNLIKIILSDKTKYKNAIGAIKKDITHMPLALKKKLEKENSFFIEIKMVSIWSVFYNLKNLEKKLIK